MPRFRFEGVHSIPVLLQQIQAVARKATTCEPRSILVELVSVQPCPRSHIRNRQPSRTALRNDCIDTFQRVGSVKVDSAARTNTVCMAKQGIEQPEAPLVPTLGLTMMVKNEADFIVQTLNSTKPFIDHWTIVDTGERLTKYRNISPSLLHL